MVIKKVSIILIFSSALVACPVSFKHTCKEQKPFFQTSSSVSLTPPTVNTQEKEEAA